MRKLASITAVIGILALVGTMTGAYAAKPIARSTLTIGASNGFVQITGVRGLARVKPGHRFTVTFNYTITDDACPGCIDQIEIGLANGPPTTCAFNGQPGPTPGVTARATVTLTAPTTPGTYYIAFDRSQHFSCALALATGNWWNFSFPAPAANYIAGIAVY